MTQNAWRLAVVAVGVALLLAGCGPSDPQGAVKAADTSADTAGGHRKCAQGQALDQCPVVTDTPSTTSSTSTTSTKPPAPAVKAPTVAQQQALDAAQSYIDMQGFSRKGLLRQLTSKVAEGFSTADATWAVNHVKVDWNAEAVEAAKSYMDMGGFSRASLIRQLTSSYGDGFTRAQAQYAARKVGL